MTIYALSTGPGISGIAVIRVSGKETASVIKKVTGKDLPVNFLITDAVSLPETLITAIPEIPGPVDKA